MFDIMQLGCRKMQVISSEHQHSSCSCSARPSYSVLCLFVCRLQWLGAFPAGGVLPAADRSHRPLQTHQPPQPLRLGEHTTTTAPQAHAHTQPHTPQTGDWITLFQIFCCLLLSVLNVMKAVCHVSGAWPCAIQAYWSGGFYSTQTLQRLVLLIKALRSRDQKLLFDTAAGEFGENENL